MLADIGYFALFLIFIASLAQANFVFIKAERTKNILTGYSNYLIFVLSTICFFSLLISHAISDFSVSNVYENSHTDKPLIFKISGTWGNHEGSLILFIWLLSIYSFLFSIRKNLEASFEQKVLSFQGLIISLFAAFSFFTSNPFLRILPAPENGLGLNPILQDIGLAIHPPMLYLGYTGYSLVISFAVAALLTNNIGKKISGELKFWSNISWSLLTLGIAIGSWWAYRELGWGGFWFWDPVENSSLLPWLTGTALLHSIIVLNKREGLKLWVIALSILTFTLCLAGFFLVRSGVLTSVHSFANSPERGVFIILIMLVISGISFFLLGQKADKIKSKNDFLIFSKEGMILINNLFIITLTGIVFLGTVFPLIMQAFGEHVSVGAPYFNLSFNPIAIITILISGLAPLMAWKSDKFKNNKKYFYFFATAAIISLLIIMFNKFELSLNIASISAAIVLLVHSFLIGFDYKKMKLKKLPANSYGVIISHAGAAVLCIGIAISTGWQKSDEITMKQGDRIKFHKFDVKLENVEPFQGKNFISRKATFLIEKDGNFFDYLKPETRFFLNEKDKTTEAAINYGIFSNLYIIIGNEVENAKGKFAVRIYYKPFINLIWLGAIMIAMGGLLSIARKKK